MHATRQLDDRLSVKTLSGIVRSMRPRQWTKNLLLYAGVIFASRFFDPTAMLRATAGFAVFCLVSGAVYLFNDLHDVESDRQHETKRLRPLASGALSPAAAIAAIAAIAIVALGGAYLLGADFLGVVLGYLALQIVYTFWVKDIEILDVMAISSGFLLRAYASAVAIRVPVSTWLLICTGLLALFLALGKRRHELLLLEDRAHSHRVALRGYSAQLIDQLIASVTALTIMSFALYTVLPGPGSSPKHERLVLTVPFVIYGVFRYLKLVYMHQQGGDPEEILLKDRPMIIDVVLFVIAAGICLYLP